jgi:hypothetical protein
MSSSWRFMAELIARLSRNQALVLASTSVNRNVMVPVLGNATLVGANSGLRRPSPPASFAVGHGL